MNTVLSAAPAPSRSLCLGRRQAELRERLDALRDDPGRAEPLEADFAEQAVQRENHEVVSQIEEATLSELAQVEHALSRIARGEGDDCERCGEPIGHRRLQCLPWATTCSDCAQKSVRVPRG